MRISIVSAVVLALSALFQLANPAHAQELKTTGWGSLSGKVTFDGEAPTPASLQDLMKKHNDAGCCLAGKPLEKIDQTWLVDPKTLGVANVMVWVKAPAGKYLPTHVKYKKRDEDVVIDQPHCAFIPRISAFNPYYRDGAKKVPTGQSMIIKNSATVNHNVRGIGKDVAFNVNVPSKTDLDISKKLQPPVLPHLPVNINCDIHPWMSAKLFVFDHPYYAVTKADGTFEIPIVPAGAEVSIMAWHEGVGYVLTNKGKTMTINEGKNTLDFQVKAPPK